MCCAVDDPIKMTWMLFSHLWFMTSVFSFNIISDLTASHHMENMINLPYNLYEDIMKLNMQVRVAVYNLKSVTVTHPVYSWPTSCRELL